MNEYIMIFSRYTIVTDFYIFTLPSNIILFIKVCLTGLMLLNKKIPIQRKPNNCH